MQNPLSLRAFLSWVEKQPADKEYDYLNPHKCACGQYAASIGMDAYEWAGAWGGGSPFWTAANKIAVPRGMRICGTFGDLASLLREQVQ